METAAQRESYILENQTANQIFTNVTEGANGSRDEDDGSVYDSDNDNDLMIS